MSGLKGSNPFLSARNDKKQGPLTFDGEKPLLIFGRICGWQPTVKSAAAAGKEYLLQVIKNI